MSRCTIALLVLCTLGILLMPVTSDAQQTGQIPRIGVLGDAPSSFWDVFRQGLREIGYVEGQNLVMEYRWGRGRYARLPDLAAELVGLKVDIIVASGLTAIRSAKQATRTIPIVMVTGTDPVAAGLIVSHARPGGNLTGIDSTVVDLNAKRLQLLKETFPDVSLVAVLANATSSVFPSARQEVEAAAQTLSLPLQLLKVRGPDDFASAFDAAAKSRAGALIVLPSTMFFSHPRRLAELALKSRLPTISADMKYAEAGGLIAYGPSFSYLYHRAATYVDKILKGAKKLL
jgi:putative ABC transport system substrate-binding protein